MTRTKYGAMLLVRTGETVTTGSPASSICPLPMNIRDTLVSVGAVEDQVTGQRLLRQDLSAGGVLRSGRAWQLDPDAGVGVQHEARSVEADDACNRVQSDDVAGPVQSDGIVCRTTATGRALASPPPNEKGTPRCESARAITYSMACWLLSGRVKVSAVATPGVASNTAKPTTKA